MLRVEFQNAANTLTIRIEGRFVGTFAKETRALMVRCKMPDTVVVDLSEMTFVDSVGEQVLSWLGRTGTKFVGDNSYPRDVCERLDLPVIQQSNGSRFPGGSHDAANAQGAQTVRY